MILSIIIPLYNAEQYFRECIDSLYQQDLAEEDFEVIVINDGSTDGSLALAQQLAAEHTNITVVSKENEGQGVARNLGMNMAKGDYITFVDSDDYLISHTIEFILNQCIASNIDMCFTPLRIWLADGNYHNAYNSKISGIVTGEQLILSGITLGTSCAIFYKATFLKESGLLFREDIMHEDVDFIYKLVPGAKRIIVSDMNIYNYRYNPMSTDRYLDEKKQRRSILSDITIAHDLQSFAKKANLSSPIRQHYLRMTNAQIASLYIQLIKRKADKSTRQEAYKYLYNYRLFPLRGGGYTWRSTILVYIANLINLLHTKISPSMVFNKLST